MSKKPKVGEKFTKGLLAIFVRWLDVLSFDADN
jgi:hypothetical protein